jgi:manganese transport system ATP-binding protein
VDTAIRASGLEVRYGDTVAITGVDLDVPKASLLSIIGPNGAGKSALLSALAGTVQLSAGNLTIEGNNPAFVLQATDVEQSLPINVRDVVTLARYSQRGFFRRLNQKDHEAVNRSLKRLHIDHLANRQFRQLSGGERQRTLIAQGLAQESDVLLLDEPINGLDLVSRSVIIQVIQQEIADGRTVVLTTHSLDDARRSDQVLLLCTEPCCFGKPEDVLTETHLLDAFGGQHLRVGQNLVLDDPHHVH